MGAVVRVVDTLNAEAGQLGDFFRRDRAATAAEDPDMAGAAFAQHVDHVTEEFIVPALIRGHGDRVGIFLDGRPDDVFHRPVMPQVDDFAALRLNQAAHDVDRGIVAVKQGGGGYEAQGRQFGRGAGGLFRVRIGGRVLHTRSWCVRAAGCVIDALLATNPVGLPRLTESSPACEKSGLTSAI